MKVLKNIHPGKVLMLEFLLPLNISGYRLSKALLSFKPEYQIF
jgi:plasmid maintenance system antidote protein VapI